MFIQAPVDAVGVVVARLRARRAEIEEAIFARVRSVVADPVGDHDAEYMAGLRSAVGAAVEFVLAGLERNEEPSGPIPAQTIAQARRAARGGVRLEAVLRRYMVGHAVMWDYLMQEADRVELAGEGSGLRELLRAQASLLDRLVIGVAREHGDELERAGRSHELHLAERVRMLLAGERADGSELGYELDAWHLGVIARGADAKTVVQGLAGDMDRRLLCLPRGEGTVWAWLSGQRGFEMAELGATTRALSRLDPAAEVSIAVGEPAWGLEGWRLTHRQAQAALVVALRRSQRLTRYVDVALLAAALKDEMLARALIDTYLTPLDDDRDGGPVLRKTLRAYLTAEHNVSSAAAGLGVVRNTVKNRLRTVEERLGRPLHPCPAELEVALELDELGVGAATEISLLG